MKLSTFVLNDDEHISVVFIKRIVCFLPFTNAFQRTTGVVLNPIHQLLVLIESYLIGENRHFIISYITKF